MKQYSNVGYQTIKPVGCEITQFWATVLFDVIQSKDYPSSNYPNLNYPVVIQQFEKFFL